MVIGTAKDRKSSRIISYPSFQTIHGTRCDDCLGNVTTSLWLTIKTC
jgi:hypothetical protein